MKSFIMVSRTTQPIFGSPRQLTFLILFTCWIPRAWYEEKNVIDITDSFVVDTTELSKIFKVNFTCGY